MKAVLMLFICLLTLSLSAQMTPEEVVQKQLETYNNRDIDGFMSVIDKNIIMRDFHSGEITLEGYAACKKIYDSLLKLRLTLTLRY